MLTPDGGAGGGGGWHTNWTPLDRVIAEWRSMADLVASARESLDAAAPLIGDNFGWVGAATDARGYQEARAELADALTELRRVYDEDAGVLEAFNRSYATAAEVSRTEYNRLLGAASVTEADVASEVAAERAAEEQSAREAEEQFLRDARRGGR